MSIRVLALAAHLATPQAAQPPVDTGVRHAAPVLAFPDRELDDSVAYQGYRTRFFRDASRNTLQVLLDEREGRVVHLWADAENESLGLTARDGDDRPAALRWGGGAAVAGRDGRARTLTYTLRAEGPTVRLGHFLLGSMRVERDFQHERRHRAPLDTAPYVAAEFGRLVGAVGSLDAAERRRHLAPLGLGDGAALAARLRPTVRLRRAGARWAATVVQPTLDGRDSLRLEVHADAARVDAALQDGVLTLTSRGGGAAVPFTVRVATTGRALRALARTEIFTPDFLAFLAEAQAAGRAAGEGTPAMVRARRLERQVRGVELLASREKLMAGLPTYATYFGRDMMVTALMMRPIWRPETFEFVMGSVLDRLSPSFEVSHEEAIGGQAAREAASEYAALVAAADSAARRQDSASAARLRARAATVLAGHRRARENYHMVDDELQLPVLAARWIGDPLVPPARKRAFLLQSTGSRSTRATQLLGELALVARITAPYAADPVVANLISFPPREADRWFSASWRDSGAGYGGGRYGMDVNAIWAPHALRAIGEILAALSALGVDVGSALAAAVPGPEGEALRRYVAAPAALEAAVRTWEGAERHFLVRRTAAEARAQITARLATMPAAERAYWTRQLDSAAAIPDTLAFHDVALDASGRPIGVLNTDVATRLFLEAPGGTAATGSSRPRAATLSPAEVARDVALVATPYPVGLLVERVGPVVANDAFASPTVWSAFAADAYHGPRVVWGRETNLFLLGVAAHASAATPEARASLLAAAERVRTAVDRSGFHAELWSYDFVNGLPEAVRYGSGNDIQLWSTTDLAVEYAYRRLRR